MRARESVHAHSEGRRSERGGGVREEEEWERSRSERCFVVIMSVCSNIFGLLGNYEGTD